MRTSSKRSRSKWGRAVCTPLGIIATTLLLGLLVVAVIVAPLMQSRAGHIDVAVIGQRMSGNHPFGTDQLGRDILARTLVAARLSVALALLTTLLGSVLGALLGTLPIVIGRGPGRVVVAGINLLIAFPVLLLALFLSMIFGVGAKGAVLALAVGLAPGFARLTHTMASAIAGADYVSAARMVGVSRRRIVWRHVLPNIAEPLVVNATSAVGSALLGFAALSYLGFGVQAPSYDWGRMLSDGLAGIYTNPAAALAPAMAIVIAGIAFVLAGEVAAQVTSGQRARRYVATKIVPPVDRVRPKTGDARPVIEVENLSVTFPGEHGSLRPVDGVSFRLNEGEIVGVVGESGSGKSLTGAALGCLVPYPGVMQADVLDLKGENLRTLTSAERRHLLGTSLATVFQDPMSALNPAVRVGRQLAEVAEVHLGLRRKQALDRAVDRLQAVRIGQPERRVRQYPSEFSGGMRQRAVIGMGLMAEPVVIVADEPTTALDVTVQREVLRLLREVRDDRGTAVLFISHDIAVVAELASRVLVMYAGRIVEDLPVADLADHAAHPYTRALVGSIPDMGTNLDEPLATIPGRPPELGSVLEGCAFAERCDFADRTCRAYVPPLVATLNGGRLACWHPQSATSVTGAGVLEVHTDDAR